MTIEENFNALLTENLYLMKKGVRSAFFHALPMTDNGEDLEILKEARTLANSESLYLDFHPVSIDSVGYNWVFAYKYPSQKIFLRKIFSIEDVLENNLKWLEEWLIGLLLGYDPIDIADFIENYPIPYPPIAEDKEWVDYHSGMFLRVFNEFFPQTPGFLLDNEREKMLIYKGVHAFLFRGDKKILYGWEGDPLYEGLPGYSIGLSDERLVTLLKHLHFHADEAVFRFVMAKLLGYNDAYIFEEIFKEAMTENKVFVKDCESSK